MGHRLKPMPMAMWVQNHSTMHKYCQQQRQMSAGLRRLAAGHISHACLCRKGLGCPCPASQQLCVGTARVLYKPLLARPFATVGLPLLAVALMEAALSADAMPKCSKAACCLHNACKVRLAHKAACQH